MKWEDITMKVSAQATAAMLSEKIYKKVSSTKINSLAIIRPSYYISHISEQMMDYITFVDRFLIIPEREWESYLRLMLHIKDCCRSISMSILQMTEPLEILIENLEEAFESEEFAEDTDDMAEEEEEEPAAPLSEEEKTSLKTVAETHHLKEESHELVREAYTSDKEVLEENLRVKLRDEIGISDRIAKELAKKLSDVYLECVHYLKSLIRLENAPDDDVSSILSILIDMQYGLDDQLRRLLMEDFFIEDLPSYSPGLNTWIAHFLDELTEILNSEESSLAKK